MEICDASYFHPTHFCVCVKLIKFLTAQQAQATPYRPHHPSVDTTMKLALLLPLLVVAFETSHAKDVARGDGGRLRALQEELSMSGDMSLPGVEIETPEVSPAKLSGSKSSKKPTLSPAPSSSELCPGVIKSSKSGKGKKEDTYCLDQECGRCVALYTLFEEQGCWDLITAEDPFDQCLALPAIEELLLDQIPKCLLLVVYGALADCIDGPKCDTTCYPDSALPRAEVVAVAGSGSGSGTLFGLTMNDLNDYARANLPQNIVF